MLQIIIYLFFGGEKLIFCDWLIITFNNIVILLALFIHFSEHYMMPKVI